MRERAVAQSAAGAQPGRDEPQRSRNRVARLLWTALGVVTFALGTVGTVLPILPTVPFYLAALFCFAKGSQRLHDWFVGTNLYHKHLEDFVDHRGMTMRTKLSIIGMVTLVMGIAFALMGRVPAGRVILAVVWVAHLIYFMGFVKTDKPARSGEGATGAAPAKEMGAAGAARPVPAWAVGLDGEPAEWRRAAHRQGEAAFQPVSRSGESRDEPPRPAAEREKA